MLDSAAEQAKYISDTSDLKKNQLLVFDKSPVFIFLLLFALV